MGNLSERWRACELNDERFAPLYGEWRPVVGEVVGKFLACGILAHGFARVRCPGERLPPGSAARPIPTSASLTGSLRAARYYGLAFFCGAEAACWSR
jgi:hypothetical protein